MATQVIDLRSDTVTKPDAEMRKAMAEAEVGDDVYGEDPTVRALEEEGAAALGFEAALFVPSGIMGNQIGLRLAAPRGTELLCDWRAHVLLYEVGALAALSGIQARPLPSEDGLPALEAFRAAIVPRGDYRVPTGAIALENTHNVAGGRAFGRDRIGPIVELARAAGLPVHVDGARIWNAAVALGTTPAELVRGATSVMFCLSKGLGAPIGSLLCSSRDRIAEAVEIRRQLGGAMRQVGVVAAAGRVALRRGPERLAADHAHARRIAEALAERPEVEIDPDVVDTNIGIFAIRPRQGAGEGAPARDWGARARAAGVLLSALDDRRVRFVTHRDLSATDVEEALRRLGGLA
ncbi:MAG TPA: GntG family PLP-dependent aldolase [Thermoanaerobaculia bacterium]|nr:GntG family PLP-dependent aldolase [Thermoanaerobaculia bacterium]